MKRREGAGTLAALDTQTVLDSRAFAVVCGFTIPKRPSPLSPPATTLFDMSKLTGVAVFEPSRFQPVWSRRLSP